MKATEKTVLPVNGTSTVEEMMMAIVMMEMVMLGMTEMIALHASAVMEEKRHWHLLCFPGHSFDPTTQMMILLFEVVKQPPVTGVIIEGVELYEEERI